LPTKEFLKFVMNKKRAAILFLSLAKISEMAESFIINGNSKVEKYESLLPQLNSLVEGEDDLIANISNIVAALKYGMEFFWVGVYFVKSNSIGTQELVLGPFQGQVACTRIAYGKGVCGACWKEKKTMVVEDVEKFTGHIACSSLSKSEIVLPAFDKNGNVALVFDIDSEELATFDETDVYYLGKIMQIIEKFI
jgi:GAF domain-containing protein